MRLLLVSLLGGLLLAAPQLRPVRWHVLSPAASYGAGGVAPWFVQAADLNGDGKNDLAVVNKESATMGLLAGNGDGTFRPAAALPAGADPRRLIVADLNEDRAPDVVTIGYFANGLTVWLNDGRAGFLPGVYYALSGHGRTLGTADLNGDGHLDLIATSDGSGQPIVLHVFLGDGAGGFAAGQVERTTFATARNLEVADVDGDGRSDVLMATNDNAGHILIWAGRGDGTLALPTALPPIVDPPLLNDGTQRLICVDLNGDGRVDLAVAHFATPFDVISVRLGHGDGTFGNARIWPTPSPVDLAAGDLNRDGQPDLAVASYGAQTVTCFLNLGGGELRQSSVLPVGDVPFSLALADLNGDGWTDAAVAGNSGHSVTVLLNRIPEHRRPPAER